jgi:hypothetical protein
MNDSFLLTLLEIHTISSRRQSIADVRLEEGSFKIGSVGTFNFEGQDITLIIKGVGILKQSLSEIKKRQKDKFTLLIETPGFDLSILGKQPLSITVKGK